MFVSYFLVRNHDGLHHVQTVSGGNAAQAERMIDTSLTILSLESSYQSASEKARQLNAANGIVPGGCSNC